MYTPVRKPVTRSKGRVVGYFASYKNNRMMEWESQLERDFLMTLEVNPNVISYSVQPSTIKFHMDGKPKRYTPDVYVECDDANVFYEVKPAKDAVLPNWQDVFAKARQYFERQGACFEVVTEDDIYREPAFSNTQLILSRRLGLHCKPDYQALCNIFDGNAELPLDTVSELCGPEGESLSALQYVACGYLQLDLHQAITGKTMVSLATGRLADD